MTKSNPKLTQLEQDLARGQVQINTVIRFTEMLHAALKIVLIFSAITALLLLLLKADQLFTAIPIVLVIVTLPFALNDSGSRKVRNLEDLSLKLMKISDNLKVHGENALYWAIDEYLKISSKIPS